ncbi:MAG: STAS domain-containing protein [Phycisphaerales bacterium]
MELRLCEIDRDHNLMVLAIDGGLDNRTAEEFVAQVTQLVEGGVNRIIVDCAALNYVSSAGLAALLRVHARMRRLEGDVRLAGLRHAVAQVLRLTHLDRLLEMYPDVEQARLSFRAK